MLTLLGMLALGFILLSKYFLGSKRRIAFLFELVGCVLWIYVAIERTPVMFELAIANFIFGFLAIRNFILWGKK